MQAFIWSLNRAGMVWNRLHRLDRHLILNKSSIPVDFHRNPVSFFDSCFVGRFLPGPLILAFFDPYLLHLVSSIPVEFVRHPIIQLKYNSKFQDFNLRVNYNYMYRKYLVKYEVTHISCSTYHRNLGLVSLFK